MFKEEGKISGAEWEIKWNPSLFTFPKEERIIKIWLAIKKF